MPLSKKQQELIADLNLIADPHERLAVLVAKGARSSLPADQRTDANLVPGCVSRVWLVGALENGACQFRCDADSPMVKGLVALLCDLYSGGTPENVLAVEPEVWERAGFSKMLSPTRLNGLRAVRKKIRELAETMAG